MSDAGADTDTEILAVAAHELKNALSGISVALMRCEQRLAGGGAVTKEDLATARAEVRRLSRLTNDLLDGARVDLGTLEVRPALVDLGELVRAGAETFQASSGRPVAVRVAPAPAQVRADAERIRGVLANLLENANKYAPGRDAIEVTVAPAVDATRVRLSVRDHGPGIAPVDQARVFERYARASGDGSARGLGLGLFLCRSIVRAHGGEVGVDSTPGAGATFWCDLPRATEDDHPAAAKLG